MSDDERLLAEALRAKASQSGAHATPLAGSAPVPVTSFWILLLAVLLGLATGTVIGLLTVL